MQLIRHNVAFSKVQRRGHFVQIQRQNPNPKASHQTFSVACIMLRKVSNVNKLLFRLGSSSGLSTTSAVHPLYPKLLEPLNLVGGVTLKNRVLMGSMHTGLEEPGGIFTRGGLEGMAAYFAERAKGEVGLIVTGGISPNNAGRGYIGAAKMSTMSESEQHNVVTDAVHAHGGKIAMQILHTGRYAYHPFPVSASPIQSPIGMA